MVDFTAEDLTYFKRTNFRMISKHYNTLSNGQSVVATGHVPSKEALKIALDLGQENILRMNG